MFEKKAEKCTHPYIQFIFVQSVLGKIRKWRMSLFVSIVSSLRIMQVIVIIRRFVSLRNVFVHVVLMRNLVINMSVTITVKLKILMLSQMRNKDRIFSTFLPVYSKLLVTNNKEESCLTLSAKKYKTFAKTRCIIVNSPWNFSKNNQNISKMNPMVPIPKIS